MKKYIFYAGHDFSGILDTFESIFSKVDKETIAVVCGRYKEFDWFCRQVMQEYEDGEGDHDGKKYICITTPEKVRGIRFDGIIYWGSYYKNPNVLEIASLIRLR